MNDIVFDADLLSLLPPWYREVLDYQQICLTEADQLEALGQAIYSIAENFFFQTMDAGAVAQWESILGIVASPSDTLSFRQARLINRISTKPPFTLGFLYQKLDELIGPGKWAVNVDYPNYTLYIESSAEDQSYASELAFTVGKIKPAHITYVNTPLVESTLLLSEQISTANRIWNYKLSSWQLGVLPFATDTDAEVTKMANIPSVQPQLLSDVANFVSSDVAQARLNGVYIVSTISKAVTDNVLTVSYTVTPAQVAVINKIELLDALGNPLTSSTAYIPVTDTVVVKHSIPVQEGTN